MWSSFIRDTDWHDDAACKGADPSHFIHSGRLIKRNGTPTSELKRMADLAITECSRCPVREKCRDQAIDDQYALGLWGGEVFTLSLIHI